MSIRTSLTGPASWVRERGAVWAIADSVAQRAFASALALSLTFLVSPSSLGAIATTTFALTLYQALFDAPLRLSGTRVLLKPGGRETLRHLRLLGALVGFALVAGAACFAGARASLSQGEVLGLALLALAPVANAVGLSHLVRAQLQGRWGDVARWRLSALTLSTLGAIPALLEGWVTLAVSLQVTGAELVFVGFLIMRTTTKGALPPASSARNWRDPIETMSLSVTGWILGQTERLVLVVAGSSGAVGIFSVGFAIARAPSDAIAAGLTNDLATKLARNTALAAREFRRTVLRAQLFAVVSGLGSILLAQVLLPRWLSSEWDPALKIAAILAITAPGGVHAWVCATLVNSDGRTRDMIPLQSFQLIAGVAVGMAYVYDLEVGALASLLRQVGVSAWITRVANVPARSVPGGAWLLATALLAAFATSTGGVW